MPSDKVSIYKPQTQQQEPIAMMTGPAQKAQLYPVASQYKHPAVYYNESFKNNQMVQPPAYDMQTMNQSLPNNSFLKPSSMVSTNPMLQMSLASQQQQKNYMNAYFDQSNLNKNNPRYQSVIHTAATDESFVLYNEKNKHSKKPGNNRHGAPNNNAFRDKVTDDAKEPKRNWVEWLSQPLCLGLTRCSGGILFGTMAFLACGSFAGLIASIVLYARDSNTDSQWKILGMVICSIMLITIIITLLIFVCCYKHGFMINADDDDDPADQVKRSDGKHYERQRDPVRNYQINPANDSTSIPSGILQDVSTSKLLPRLVIQVSNKQTNTEATISQLRSKDFNRGVWPSEHVYGGISYVPQVPPKMASHSIQVVPHEIDETLVTNVPPVYQIVNPVAAIPTKKSRPKMIQTSDEEQSVFEVIEPTRKQQQLASVSREVQKQKIIMQPKPRMEYVHAEESEVNRFESDDLSDEEPQHIEHIVTKGKRPKLIQYVDTEEDEEEEEDLPQLQHTDNKPKRTHQIEYVPAKEERKHPQVKQPQYEIVEDVNERARSSSIEQIDEVPKHERKRGRKKHKKQGFKKVSVKHVKSTN